MAPAPEPRGLRADIEGLRAVAVALVVVYHLFPAALPGGFVGVDAFFVISGFLITTHLLAEEPTTLGRLGAFWSRRIRRLLPAALTVLAVTLLASRLVAPETQWESTARQARAATLYVLNWLLAEDAVDYLAAENAASPVQHYWSLSVEEQFYVVWPLLIGALVLLARRLGISRRLALTVGLGAVVAASLAYSAYETAADPEAAYFVSPTRMWELGLGGLLALAVAAPRRRLHAGGATRAPAVLGAWAGLALLGWGAATYTGATPFPGLAALAPVLGTALVILAHPRASDRGGPGGLLALRPVQWLGGVSYSVYLWHWPLVVLVPYLSGGRIGVLDALAIVAATLGLAALTKRYVEDPFRTRSWRGRVRLSYGLAAAGMAVLGVLATLQVAEVQRVQEREELALARAVFGDDPCFGPRSLEPGRSCEPVSYDEVVPAPVLAAEDRSEAYGEVSGKPDCMARRPGYRLRTCSFGDTGSDVRVALFGNSHAGQWLPALQLLGEQHGWRVDTFLAARCAAAEVDQAFGSQKEQQDCRTWTAQAVERIAATEPDLVVFANRISLTAAGHDLAASLPLYADGYEAVLRQLRAAGIPVLVVRDTPAPSFSIPDCVAEHDADLAACDGTREAWLPTEPLADVVTRLADPGVTYVDLTDRICGPQVCRAVTGGVVTYFDGSHLTATYSSALAPYLEQPLRAALGEGRRPGRR